MLEHKFASSLSGDTGDVDFDFGHVETQFRVLSKPLAHLNQHLEGCLEGGIDVQIVGETNPASITMAGEHATYDGVLRQTITHHLQAIPLLTASCALDVMGLPAVITITVVGGGAVHGVEVSNVVLWGGSLMARFIDIRETTRHTFLCSLVFPIYLINV